MREVFILGAGLHPFGRFPQKNFINLATEAASKALEDGRIEWKDIQAAVYSRAFFQGLSPGEAVCERLGLSGIPVVNVENACSSGTTAAWLSYHLISSGAYDAVICIGAEMVPKGPMAVTLPDSPEKYLGRDFMMTLYSLKARRYMQNYGAPIEAIAQVSVVNHKNGCLNPYAQYKKAFTLDEVLNSRMVADPLTLYQCCPTSEGAAAVVLCSRAVARKHTSKPLIKLAGIGLATNRYFPDMEYRDRRTEHAAQIAYEMAGLGPGDVDATEVHDAATIGEICQAEACGLLPQGEGWRAVREGRTEISGDIPINTGGGLQALGHPIGATGLRQIVELTWQLRGEAGARQVPNAKVALAQTAGYGGVSNVAILAR